MLAREFTAAAPNQRWVSDTTEFVIGESGKVNLAAILDLYSRFVAGWAVSAVNDRRLTLKALEMAVHRCCPEPRLLHHSDRHPDPCQTTVPRFLIDRRMVAAIRDGHELDRRRLQRHASVSLISQLASYAINHDVEYNIPGWYNEQSPPEVSPFQSGH